MTPTVKGKALRAFIRGRMMIGEMLQSVATLPTTNMDELRKIAVAQAMKRHDGSVRRAAKDLGVGPATLYRWLLPQPDGTVLIQ